MTATIAQMTSGECRWVGREDLHVYCWAPFGRQPRYKVWTVDSVGSPWDDNGWTTAANVARQIESLMAQETAA